MLRKIVTFQKSLYRVSFSQASTTFNKQDTFANKIEILIQPICILIVYFSAVSFLSGISASLLIIPWLLTFIYKLLYQSSFIFQLPVKRSFVIENLYIFTISNILILSVLFFCILMTVVFVPSGISDLISGGKLPVLTEYEITMFQSMIIMIAYSIAYTSVVTTFYFVNKIKVRLALTIIFALILSGVNFYVYITQRNRSNDKYISLNETLMKMPNSWHYVAIAVFIAIIVSGCGMFIAIRLSKKKSTIKARTI